jgi:triosephosphate isomerase
MSKIIVANWKMNPQSQKEVEVFLSHISLASKNIKNTQIIICPPNPFLFIFKKNKNKKIILGAQNISCEVEGSYTGEVSPKMLLNMGVKNVIIGHSERRRMGENDKIINKKILNSIKFKLSPIICIGENNRDREGFYLSFVKEQIKNCLAGVSVAQMKSVVIAYEPIWAIGKSAIREATCEEFIEMKIFIKKVISDIYNPKIAHSVPILYGGSVNTLNAKSFLTEGEADGLLIGRDSLNSKKFGIIINI